jgi:Kef-type K+ transport system membrane component KefB
LLAYPFSSLFLEKQRVARANGLLIVLKMPLYLVIASVVGIWLIPKLGHYAENLPVSQELVASGFITVLLYAWAAEALGGMAGTMGAFAAGLFVARSPLKELIEASFAPLVYGVFVPVFLSTLASRLTCASLPVAVSDC